VEIGDKVRTNAVWNSTHEPFEATVMQVEILKCSKVEYELTRDPQTGLDVSGPWRDIPGEFEYIRNLVLDNGKTLHESNLEKVD
jgi:hypothetical protein